MKKFLFLIITAVLSMPVFAQLEVKEGSFKEVAGFVNINTEMMYDDNDRAYSVVKVKTENINDKERHQLLFEGDARTFFELEYKPGEVWVYISYYATYLKISHPDFGSTEFWFPFDMQGKKGYELTIVNKSSIDQEFADRLAKLEGALAGGSISGEYGFLVIKTTPVDGAMVVIDGEEMAMKTPFVSEKLGVGPHRVRVEKDFYKPYVIVVSIESGQTKHIDVELQKQTGSLEVVTKPSDANIKINWEDKGRTPKSFNEIQAGNYKIELSKNKYETAVKDVLVKDGEKAVVEVELVKAKSSRNKGLVFIPEIGVSITQVTETHETKNYILFLQQLNMYYMVGSCFGIGIGGGLNIISPIYVPLYGQVLFYFNDRDISPYINAKIGYNICLSGKQYYDNWGPGGRAHIINISGVFESLSLGYNIKKSKLGLSLNYFNYQDKLLDVIDIENAFSVGITYSYTIPFR